MSKHFTSILQLVPADRQGETTANELEKLAVQESTVTLPDQPHPQATRGPTSFKFDQVFEQHHSSVYKYSVKDIVDSVLVGYNGTVITLANEHSNKKRREALKNPTTGAIWSASQQVFHCLMKSRKKQAQACSNLVMLCSFVIIINENVHDLLAGFSSMDRDGKESDGFPPKLTLVDGALSDATQQEITNTTKMSSLLQYRADMEKRVVQAYQSEASCSESPLFHTMCTITVEYAQFGTMNAPISGNLTFVEVGTCDFLSGKAAADAPEISKETVSLQTFSDVVNALTKEATSASIANTELPLNSSLRKTNIHKKSVLTELLQEALGGNCKTLVLSYVASEFAAEEYTKAQTLLELASQARQIQNSPNKKDLAEKALMTAYMRELRGRYGSSESEGVIPKPTKSPAAWSGDGTGMVQDSSAGEERQHNMEMAASALAAAIQKGYQEGEGESDGYSSNEEELGAEHRPKSTKVKLRRKSTHTKLVEETGSWDVSVDALLAVLQDPDNGVPRPSVTALTDVKLRKDVGAIFSGAAIVAWMIENVDGVNTEAQAVALGDLLLVKGALVHSEGSMVFANAETLFYYAKKGRPNRRTLSQQEIQSLLAQAHISSDPTAKKGRKESTIHEIDNEFCTDGRDDASLEGSFNLVSPKSRKKKSKRRSSRIHEVDNEAGGNKGEAKRANSSRSRSRHGSELMESSDSVFVPSNPTTPVSPEQEAIFKGSSPYLQERPLSQQAPSGHSSPTALPTTDDPLGGGDEPDSGVHSVSPEYVDQALMEEQSGMSRGNDLEGQKAAQETTEVSTSAAGEESESSDPNTAPVEHIPTVQTLEKSINYPNPLHMAVAIGKSPGVVRELVMMFGVDKLDDHHRTPLMFAALGNNRRSSCTTLIECGAAVNRRDISGLTALHVACYHGHKSATDVLLRKGAVVDIQDAKGHTALHWSTVSENSSSLQLLMRYATPDLVRVADNSGLTALHWAIHFKRPTHLTMLLKKYGDPTQLDKEGRTLVTYALLKQSHKCIKVLISTHPSLLTHPDASQSTPLHHASAHTTPHSLLLLLSLEPKTRDVATSTAKDGQIPSSFINCTNNYQRTPLHCAVAYNSLHNADLLLRNGADVQLCDSEGKTPIDYARELENGEDMCAILEGQASFEWSASGMDLKKSSQLPAQSKENSRVCVVS